MLYRVAFVTLLVAPATARTQGRLEGTIRNSAGPITSLSSADVRLSDGQRAFVDSLGHFRFDSVPPGRITGTARAVTYAPVSATVTIRSGRTTRHDFLLHVDSFWVVKREAQWLGCRGAPPGVPCVPGRHVASDLSGRPVGAWLFRDSATFGRYWWAHATYHQFASDRLALPFLDWVRESMLVVSYGSFTGCGPRTYVNRVERRGDTTAAVAGEDSLYREFVRLYHTVPRARIVYVVKIGTTGYAIAEPSAKGGERIPAIFVDPSMTRFVGNWAD